MPADAIDAWAWDKITERLRDPQLIAEEVRNRQHEESDPHLEGDLAAARRNLQEYERQQQRLLQRYAAAGDDTRFPWDLVEREVQRLDAEKGRWQHTINEIEERMADLERARAHMESLATYCERVVRRLDTFDFPARCLALVALNVIVSATGKDPKEWHLDGEIPLQVGEHVEDPTEDNVMEPIC